MLLFNIDTTLQQGQLNHVVDARPWKSNHSGAPIELTPLPIFSLQMHTEVSRIVSVTLDPVRMNYWVLCVLDTRERATPLFLIKIGRSDPNRQKGAEEGSCAS